MPTMLTDVNRAAAMQTRGTGLVKFRTSAPGHRRSMSRRMGMMSAIFRAVCMTAPGAAVLRVVDDPVLFRDILVELPALFAVNRHGKDDKGRAGQALGPVDGAPYLETRVPFPVDAFRQPGHEPKAGGVGVHKAQLAPRKLRRAQERAQVCQAERRAAGADHDDLRAHGALLRPFLLMGDVDLLELVDFLS